MTAAAKLQPHETCTPSTALSAAAPQTRPALANARTAHANAFKKMLTTKETPPPLDVLDAHERESLRALLEARSEPDRLQAAYQLRRVVARAARETSGETFGRFEDELYGALFRAVHHGRTLENRLGGVAALEALIGAPSAEPEGKGSKFADVLSSALRRCCEGDRPSGALKENDARREFVTRCAAALGRLARRGPASSSAHVEVEVSRALAWLEEPLEKRSRYSRKRLAACLVLRELARHAPTLFYARVCVEIKFRLP